VAIARALVGSPKILLCDEPTGNLDPENADRIFGLLVSLQKTHRTTLVLITHDPDLAAACSLRVHLEKGRVSSIEGLAPEFGVQTPPARVLAREGRE
jgi:predicted ABC-type transport system involved in lysophospholipase L1 biosynthesis ATPase subunit